MKKIFFALFLFMNTSIFFVSAQTVNEQEYLFFNPSENFSKDTAKINRLYERAELLAFKLGKMREAKIITDSAYEFSKRIKYYCGLAKHWNLYGEYSEKISKYAQAVKYQNLALEICEKTDAYSLKIRIYNDLGTLYRRTDNYTNALKFHQDALKIAREMKNEQYQMFALNGIGNCNTALRNYDDAFDNYVKALEIAEKLNNKQSIAINLNNIGEVAELKKDHETAMSYYSKSLRVNLEIEDTRGIAITNSCIGGLHFEQGNYLKALGYFSSALEIEKQISEKLYAARDQINIGKCYLKLGKYEKAEKSLLEGLATALEINSKSFEKEAYYQLSQLHEVRKDFSAAYSLMKKYSEAKDSVINEKIAANYAKLQIQYELDQNRAELTILHQDKRNQQIVLIKNRIIFIAVILLVIAFATVLIVYSKNRTRKRTNQELEEKNAQITIINEQLLAEINYRSETENVLRELLHEKEILISEVHHRVKNNLAIITGLMYLQVQQVGDALSKSILNETLSRIHSIALIHDNIYQSEKHSAVDFGSYLQKQIEEIKKIYKNVNVDVELNIPDYSLELHQAVPLGLIANELISNAFRHAFVGRDSGKVIITFTGNHALCTLEVKDNGIGLPENFDLEKVQAPGFIIISIFVKQLGGVLRSMTLGGAIFNLEFAPTKMKVWK